jgi:hypothetical protein
VYVRVRACADVRVCDRWTLVVRIFFLK